MGMVVVYLEDSMSGIYLVLRTYGSPLQLLASPATILSPPELWVFKVTCRRFRASLYVLRNLVVSDSLQPHGL